MKNSFLFLLILICFSLASCTSSKTAAAPDTGNAEITETYWRLTELKGKLVGKTAADKQEVYIKLKKAGNQLEGFAGCNVIGGQYQLKENGQISFTNIMGMMASCGDIDNETKFLDAIRAADNYYHHGKLLILFEGNKKTQLARFEALYFK